MKETFSSEKEKITCKGAMEVVDTQLYERCNIAQYCTVNDVIPVPSFLSSQCVTLGSRYKNICKLCNGQQILGAYNVHYEKTGFQCRSTGMTPILHSKLQRSYNCVSGHWDDTFQVSQITMFVQLCVSYSDDRREYWGYRRECWRVV